MRPRCVLVERPTEYQELLARHGTRDQVAFYLGQRNGSIEELELRHQRRREQHASVLGAVPSTWRRAAIRRQDLDRFMFEPEDVVVVLGQDGLVANVAKYLDGQPVIGLNPQRDMFPGVLVTQDPIAAGDLFADLEGERARFATRTMVQATLDDGQSLVALNEVFIGHASHQSARYRISYGDRSERHSSSGLIVTTGTGATGWAASIRAERHSALRMPDPAERRLAFFVREPWPSITTGTDINEGELKLGEALTITSEQPENGVIFGDGIEADRLHLDWGQRVRVGVADRRLNLVI